MPIARAARAARPVLWLAAAAALAGCATGAVVTRGGGASILAAQAEPGLGGKYRVMVASIIDKTDKLGTENIDQQLDVLNQYSPEVARLTRDGILHGIQDMLVTELFQQDRFIVLERAALNEVITEQEFSAGASAGDATRIPKAQLEGADLIVLGAVTAFDAGVGGGALPIPIPLGKHADNGFGVLKLRYKRGYVAMDLRVVDARTGRVLSSVAVEGRNGRFGMDFGLHLWGGHSHVDLPGVLTYFQNTPIERALQEMVTAAVSHVTERVPLH